MKRKIILFLSIYFCVVTFIAALIYLSTRPVDLKTKSEILQNFALTLAVIVGGIWATYRFFIQRAYETALEIDFAMTNLTYENGNFLVLVDMVLKNKGLTRISAKPKKYIKGKAIPVYEDTVETLDHSFALQVRRISTTIPASAVLDWFESDKLEKLDSIPDQINLLNEYDISRNGAVDFWIEPNEVYHRAIPLVLPRGRYLAKASFLGNRGNFEFWSRIFLLSVEEPAEQIVGPERGERVS
jgi:hypothetical protein